MDVRGKLVELLAHTSLNFEEAEYLADYLVKNGVTIQEWISVEDRLPEIGRSVIAYNALAKCAAEAMYKGEGMFLQFRWPARLQEHEITHWMPLPQPPKGEYLPTVDAVPFSELLSLRNNLYEDNLITMRGLRDLNMLIAKYEGGKDHAPD